MTEERRTISVLCRVPNGIALRLFREGYDDGTGTGYKPAVQDGAAVDLRGPGRRNAANHAIGDDPAVANDIDAEFWAAWVKQNEKNPNSLLARGFIAEAPSEREGE